MVQRLDMMGVLLMCISWLALHESGSMCKLFLQDLCKRSLHVPQLEAGSGDCSNLLYEDCFLENGRTKGIVDLLCDTSFRHDLLYLTRWRGETSCAQAHMQILILFTTFGYIVFYILLGREAQPKAHDQLVSLSK